MAVRRLTESTFNADVEDIIAQINRLKIGDATEDEIAQGFIAIQNAMKSVRRDYTATQKLINNSGLKPYPADDDIHPDYAVGKFNDGSKAVVGNYDFGDYYVDVIAGGSDYDDPPYDKVGVSVIIGNDDGDYIEASKDFDTKIDTLKFANKLAKQLSALPSIDFQSFVKFAKKMGFSDSRIYNEVSGDFE